MSKDIPADEVLSMSGDEVWTYLLAAVPDVKVWRPPISKTRSHCHFLIGPENEFIARVYPNGYLQVEDTPSAGIFSGYRG